MKRLFTLIMVAIAMAILAAPVAAHGHGDGPMNKKKCEEAGGYWFNERGVKSCNYITETEWEPGILEEIPDEEVRDLLARALGEREIIVFVVMQQQRGNVGARGTSSSYNLFYDSLCEALGPPDLIPPSACAILHKLVFPDD